MAPDHAQVLSCQFPSLGRSFGNDQKRPLSVRIELQQPEQLQKLFAEDNGKALLVVAVRTAWALVLHTYTGLDRVCFGLCEVGGDESPGKDAQNDLVATHLVSDDVSIGETIQDTSGDSSGTDQAAHERFQYNTSLLFRYAVQSSTVAGSSKPAPTTMAASVGLLPSTSECNAH